MTHHMNEGDWNILRTAIEQQLGSWEKVTWQRSRRHRRHGYATVTLPSGTLIPCVCQRTQAYDPGIPNRYAFAWEPEPAMLVPATPDTCIMLVYQQGGQVRHQRCGKTIHWIMPPPAPRFP